MLPEVKNRRGMTLAELTVSLAMVVIMIALVISFVTLLTGHTQANGENLAFQQDLSLIKTGVQSFMDGAAGQPLSEVNGGVTAGTKTLKFENGVLHNDALPITTACIEAVAFDLEEENGKYLLFCTVKRADSDQTYTFCVSSRVGETAGVL